MAKQKNALRKHLIAPYTTDGKQPEEGAFLPLARWISNITDDTDEKEEATGYYDGDGTEQTEIVGIAEKWAFEGTYDSADPAQELIAGMKREVGEKRKVWHKIVQTNGDVYVGVATVSGIKAGSGEATVFEEFAATLNFDFIPQKVTTPEKSTKKQ